MTQRRGAEDDHNGSAAEVVLNDRKAVAELVQDGAEDHQQRNGAGHSLRQNTQINRADGYCAEDEEQRKRKSRNHTTLHVGPASLPAGSQRSIPSSGPKTGNNYSEYCGTFIVSPSFIADRWA